MRELVTASPLRVSVGEHRATAYFLDRPQSDQRKMSNHACVRDTPRWSCAVQVSQAQAHNRCVLLLQLMLCATEDAVEMKLHQSPDVWIPDLQHVASQRPHSWLGLQQ